MAREVRTFFWTAESLTALDKRSVKGESWQGEWQSFETRLEPRRQLVIAASEKIIERANAELHPNMGPAESPP